MVFTKLLKVVLTFLITIICSYGSEITAQNNQNIQLKIRDPKYNPKNFTKDTVIKIVHCMDCPIKVGAVMDNLDTAGNHKDVFSCGAPFGMIEDGPNIIGEYTFTPVEKIDAVLKTCLIACVNGYCDTTIVFFAPEHIDTSEYLNSIRNKEKEMLPSNTTNRIPNYISPNGDNKNDRWILPESIGKTAERIVILDTYGNAVWGHIGEYDSHFSGLSTNGVSLPGGVYFYEISTTELAPIRGFIQIGF